MLKHLTFLLTLTGLILGIMDSAAGADRWGRPKEPFVNWENPHVHPLDITPDGSKLLAVNTADNRLMVFSLGGGTPVLSVSIPVGLDPITVRAFSNTQAWVINRISNDITVVDLSANRVTAVLNTDVEPQDVVFAGSPQKAFVSCQKPNVVDIFDPSNLSAAKQSIFVNGKNPRAMAVSADGTKVYCAFFNAGNGTTCVTGGKANPFEVDLVRRPEGPYGGVNVPPNSGKNIVPPLNPANPPPPAASMIVRRNAAGRWLDDNNGDWSIFISGSLSAIGGPGGRVAGWDLPQRAVAVINTSTLAVTYQSRIMNLLMAVAVQPGTGNVTAVGTDATNQIRWEPNVDGKFIRVNLASFTPGGPTTITDLNPHLNYTTSNIPIAQRQLSIGDPRGIAWNSTGTQAWVTGMGSNNVILISGSGTRLGIINVGQGPTGVVYKAATNRVYVLNKFDGSISMIDAQANVELARVPFFDPTPAVIKNGRPFLYNTQLTSGLGQISCASCHVDGRTDGLAWDLGNPAGSPVTITGTDDTTGQLVTVQTTPMKGPLLTMTLQDDMNVPVMHWSGDRPELSRFAGAFQTLQGADAPLSTASVNAMEDFLATIHIPPNPNRNLDNTYATSVAIPGPNNTINRVGNALAGSVEFVTDGCNNCHFGDMARSDLIRQGGEFGLNQMRRSPTWRNFNERAGLWFQSADGSNMGFGYQQDGTFDSTHNQTRTDNMMAFMYSVNGRFPSPNKNLDETTMSRDTHAAVGTQLLFSSSATGPQDGVLTELVTLAEHGEIGLVAKAEVNGAMRGYAYVGDGIFQSDQRSEQDTLATVRALPNVLFTAVPAGSEIRIGIDEDLDGTFDGDQTTPLGSTAVVRSGTNIAAHGIATQSSDYAPQFVASAAIDGSSNTFSHTASGDHFPWWNLTLDNTYAIDHITLVNRAGFESRLRDISVYFYDAAGNPIYRSHFLNRDNRLLDPSQITLDLVGALNVPINAKSLRIFRTPDYFLRAFDLPATTNNDETDVLTLAEVQVFGAASPNNNFILGSIPRPLPGGTFEDLVETGTYAYDPTGTPWTFTGQSGITGNSSGFTSSNSAAPEGTQVAFLQNKGSFSQTVTLNGGTYRLNFYAAQRAGDSVPQSLMVVIDGSSVGTFTPAATSYSTFQTNTFRLGAGPHTFAFAGLGVNPNGTPSTDTTVFVDDITIAQVAPPVISSIPAQTTTRGIAVTLQVHASDPAGKALTYSASGLPTGLAINSSSGLVSGTVSSTAAASSTAQIIVSDGTLSATATFAWLTTAPVAPSITSPGAQSSLAGSAVSLQVSASGLNGLPITFAASGLPAGLSISPTGLISGTVSASASAANNVTVTVHDSLSSASVSFAWSVSTIASLPLTGIDIGAPGKAGSNSFSGGVYTVTGGGADLGNTSDQCHFVGETFTGDGQIIARVTSQTNTGPAAKAGVMFRETSNANSRFAAMLLTPYNGFNFEGRDTTGGGAGLATANSYTPPNNWVRVVRSGSQFSGYISSDGVNWTLVGVDTNPMATSVQVGLVVTSHDNTVTGTATFDNVQIKP